MRSRSLFRLRLALTALVLPLSLCARAATLRPGDTVDIRIANVPLDDIQQFNGTYTVDESGNLHLPYINDVKAAGLAPSQVQVDVQQKFISQGIYTNPTITIAAAIGQRFLIVGGAVRAPGRVPFTPDLTMMGAISAAGGPSDFAGDKIRLVRGGKVELFSRKTLYKDPSKDPRIEPGDQIEVIQSMW